MALKLENKNKHLEILKLVGDMNRINPRNQDVTWTEVSRQNVSSLFICGQRKEKHETDTDAGRHHVSVHVEQLPCYILNQGASGADRCSTPASKL